MNISPALPEHHSDILDLNETAFPHVNSITESELSDLAAESFYFKVAIHGGAVAGFLLALAPGAGYKSINYRWFSAQYEQFIYVDRIVVSSTCFRSGLGKRLYGDLEKTALKASPVLTCEVNLKPENPVSLAFHQKLGFKEVGQLDTEGGMKRVCLMCKSLNMCQDY
jgi:predicted GNAT superfamily acetyltransferase